MGTSCLETYPECKLREPLPNPGAFRFAASLELLPVVSHHDGLCHVALDRSNVATVADDAICAFKFEGIKCKRRIEFDIGI
jgi:hypothetical protein